MNAVRADIHEHFIKPVPYVTSVEVDKEFGTKIINVNWMQYQYLEHKMSEYKTQLPKKEFRAGVKYMDDKLKKTIKQVLQDKTLLAEMYKEFGDIGLEEDEAEKTQFKNDITTAVTEELKPLLGKKKFFSIKSIGDVAAVVSILVALVLFFGGIWLFNDLKNYSIRTDTIKDIVIELPQKYMPEDVEDIILKNINGD